MPLTLVLSRARRQTTGTLRWEQSAAYVIDRHGMVDAFVKNAGLGFAVLYVYNGEPHDYLPDFIVRLKTEPPCHLILETKGYDPLKDVKTDAAYRWVRAVNADGRFGRWEYACAGAVAEVGELIDRAARGDDASH